MKKFVKVSLMTAGILLVVGFVFGSIGALACGGNLFGTIREEEKLDDKIESVMDSLERNFYYSTGGRWGSVKDNEASTQTEVEVSKQIAADDISNMELLLGAGTFIVGEKGYDDGVIDIQISGKGRCDYYVKGNTFYVEGFKDIKWYEYNDLDENRIEIWVPLGSSFEKLEAETGAGMMEISNIEVRKIDAEIGAGMLYLNEMDIEKLSVDVGAGQMEASNVTARDAELNVGLGECLYTGNITGKLEAECSMGNMELALTGSETEHNYEIECGAGNIEIGSFSVSSLAAEKKINNNADSKFDIECSMGNITITFNN